MGEKESRSCDAYFLFFITHYACRGGTSYLGVRADAFCVYDSFTTSVAGWDNDAAL